MDCQVSLIYAHLALPGLDPDEVRDGQIVQVNVNLNVLQSEWVKIGLAAGRASQRILKTENRALATP